MSISAALLLTACGSGDGGESTVQVPFPQGSGEQALHCQAILTFYHLRFSDTADDALPSFLADIVTNHGEAEYEAALTQATNAAVRERAFPPGFPADNQATAQWLKQEAEPFRNNGPELSRHADMCISIYDS